MRDLRTTLAEADTETLARTIVNAPFAYKADMVLLGIGIVVLLVCDTEDQQIHRIALSSTELGDAAKRISLKKFEDIKIPVGYKTNIIAQAIVRNEPQLTSDWQYLLAPALSPEQARLNQAAGGIACSYVYPLTFNGTKGGMLFSFYKDPEHIDAATKDFMREYSQTVSVVLNERGTDLNMLQP